MTFDKTTRKLMEAVFVGAGVTLLLCLGFFLIFGNAFQNTQAPLPAFLLSENEPGLEQEREFEKQQTFTQQNASESIAIPGFEKMKIPAGQTTVPAYLYNPENNKCYFEIALLLADSKEEIYKSKLVRPGQKLYEIELNRAMEKGDYDAVVHYSTYALADYADMNGANVPFTLSVE